jgi:hypothetical protein
LDVEEFRRLGVRPNELRLGVIRKAATRMARSLAEQHLRSPSSQTAVQLSRVATSAYRLLDPRQRSDPHQRAHVGRILPNTLSVAGQTNFCTSSTETAAGLVSDGLIIDDAYDAIAPSSMFDSTSDLPTETSAADDPLWSITTDAIREPNFVDVVEQDEPVRTTDVGAWLSTLADDDLLAASPQTKKVRRLRDRILHPWVWFGAIGLIVGSGLGWITVAPQIQEASF